MRIAMLGGGPAAAMCAIELRRLGYEILNIRQPKSSRVIEGISERVFAALQLRGLGGQATQPVPRTAIWNGLQQTANSERLILRPGFDEELASFVKAAGIKQIDARVVDIDRANRLITTDLAGTYNVDFIVDARGRAAGYEAGRRQRGPESVSIGAWWGSEPGKPMTLAMSVRDGWGWLARTQAGELFAQLSLGGEPLHFRKSDIPARVQMFLEQVPLELRLSHPRGEPVARSSTPILVDQPIEAGYIRIGDAASAVDPLSGNGIFQSLSSALTAVPVINTMLARDADTEMAMDFYRARLEGLFYRFARIGRDFYRSETDWANEPFWAARTAWPDNQPVHADRDQVTERALRPVINNGFIEMKNVVLTRDQPMGIWQADGRPIID